MIVFKTPKEHKKSAAEGGGLLRLFFRLLYNHFLDFQNKKYRYWVYLMEHIFFEVQLCIKISIFNDFCENWYTDHPGLATSQLVQIWAKVTFLQNGHIPKFQGTLFPRNKSPCGSVPQKVTFSGLTLRELIHFYRDLKNQFFPKKLKLDCILPIKIHFLPKTKMVRMVHTNNF